MQTKKYHPERGNQDHQIKIFYLLVYKTLLIKPYIGRLHTTFITTGIRYIINDNGNEKILEGGRNRMSYLLKDKNWERVEQEA